MGVSLSLDIYLGIVDELRRRSDVGVGRMLKAEALQVGGKSFAYLSDKGLVLKLPPDRVSDLEAQGCGQRLRVGKRTMKGWLVSGHEHTNTWPQLAEEACLFVKETASAELR